MRAVIVDYVRERRAQERGGGEPMMTLTTGIAEASIGAPFRRLRWIPRARPQGNAWIGAPVFGIYTPAWRCAIHFDGGPWIKGSSSNRLDGLEAVAHERQRTVEHHAHRVAERRAFDAVLARDLFVVGLQNDRRRGRSSERAVRRRDRIV